VTNEWEKLNAYVDGELDPAGAAEVAAAIAREPSLARSVATLSRLKATIGDLAPAVTVAPPRQIRPWAHACMVMVAVVALLVTTIGNPQRLLPSDVESGWISPAIAAQRAWIGGASSAERSESVRIGLSAGETMRVPDLSAARLKLVHVSLGPEVGRATGLFLGYRGIHGCRVGLWIGNVPAGIAENAHPVAARELSAYAWRVGKMGYVLLAHGMDRQRLGLLAQSVAYITKDGDHLDATVEAVLRRTTVVGASCAT
jgi:hypothetical protein